MEGSPVDRQPWPSHLVLRRLAQWPILKQDFSFFLHSGPVLIFLSDVLGM